MAYRAAAILSFALLALGVVSAAQFNYTNPDNFWPSQFPLCGAGLVQSPVDVVTTSVVQLCGDDSDGEGNDEEVFKVEFNGWGTVTAEAENVGQTFEVVIEDFTTNVMVPIKDRKVYGVVQVNDDSDSSDDDDDVTFVAVTPLQFHFHTPSENTINGEGQAPAREQPSGQDR
eukprot:evm.model.scf_22.2 EVM.evm.TU.scf_22.2   scf_22:9141-12559(-)